MEQVLDPEDINHDIYDEIANLEKWQEMLSDMISNNSISQEEFDDEMLKTRYYLDLKTKTYILGDDEQEIINKLRMYKLSLKENYRVGLIDETEFNREYIKIIRKEYDILRLSESDEGTKNEDFEIDLPLEEKLKKLHDAETKANKNVARKYNIPLPKLPRGIKSDEIDRYYDLKITGMIDETNYSAIIEDYILKQMAAQKLINYYTSSYEVTKVFYNSETGKSDYEFKTIAPMSSQMSDLKLLEKRSNLLTPEEQLYSDRLNLLKSRMRKLSREDLLNCVGVRTFKYMSYIERLRQNKQNVLKFKEYPENYEELKKLVDDDLKFYKIESDKLFKDYTYSRPDVFQNQLEESESDISSYTQKGNIVYLAIKPGSDLKNLGTELDSFIAIKPFPDELYTELKDKSGNNSEIDTVWELRTSLPGSSVKNITKRYLSFEDYLKDFKDILIQNAKKTSGKSKDIILNKIRKINFYLKYSEDLEIYTSSGQISIEEIFKNKTEITAMRSQGVYNLTEYIGAFYPGSQLLIERIEADIFDYSTKNYTFNIKKILFLFKNYQNKLEDLVEGSESILNLLVYEVPRTLPDDDIDIDDKQGTIDRILMWNPDTSEYDKYSRELEENGHRFYKFKKDHPELSNLYISQIMSQYSEKILWQRSKEKYTKIEVPEGSIELNFRLRYILRQRNTLPSRRIFRLTTISDRIRQQSELTGIFKRCRVPEPEDYAILTENIILGLSVTPEDYDYYSSIVKENYRKLCSYFTKVNLKCVLDSDGMVKCIISFEPNILTPVITEFLITQGDFSTVDIVRLTNFMKEVSDNKVISYINSLRGKEIEAYFNSTMEELNKTKTPLNEIYMKASRVLLSSLRESRLNKLAEIAYSIYKPPIISALKPVKTKLGKEYTPEYIKIGDNYIYGGYYPGFYKYNEDGSIEKENYTRNDLEQLAGIYNLDFTNVDSFELYKSIMTFISEVTSKPAIVDPRPIFNPSDYNHVYNYLNTPNKTIFYTIRPRLGVPEPGEAYPVYKDQVQTFGVPFKYNKDSIPVYAEQLKERISNGFILIEGPSLFEETDRNNAIVSENYILVEYLDSRGKPKLFKEGVAEKRIIKRTEKNIESCSRFISEMTCNNPNSYSLDIKGLKYKCQWLKKNAEDPGSCRGNILHQANELLSFNISDITFEDPDKNELWKTAIDRSIEYIESVVKLKEINKEEIELLSKEQKARLFEYYKVLSQERGVAVITEDTVQEIKNYSLVETFPDILKLENRAIIPINKSEYKNITLYKQELVQLQLPFKIRFGKEYTINDITVIPMSYNSEDKTYTCKVKDTDEEVFLESELFRKKTSTLQMITKPVFCVVKEENYNMLYNYSSYEWNLKTTEYNKIGDDIVKEEKVSLNTFVPVNFINPSEFINGTPLITKNDILEAMKRTAFCTLTTDDDKLFNIIEKINATDDAIDFAIKNNINILDLQNKIVGTINLVHVIEEFEKNVPKKVMSKTDLVNIIQKAVQDKDKDTLMKYYVQAKKSKIDPDLLKEAKELIKTLPDKKEEPKEEPKIEPPKKPPVTSSIYTTQRRRR